ncbi:MAG: hypothetical protein EBX50_21390, partial [Chitinophagia bacterium]|nr:hypothetical protein [Chitinophagia bacterium]
TIVTGSLLNRTNNTQTVTYSVIPKSGNCTASAFTVLLTLSPTPEITAMSTITCSGVLFTSTPVNGTNGIVPAGTIYSWNVPTFTVSVSGGQSDINKVQISGTLRNGTNVSQQAYYRVIPQAGDCSGASFTLTVILNPIPEINAMSAVTCSGVLFRVTPTNNIDGLVPVGTLYKWDLPTYTATMTGGQTGLAQNSIFGTLRNTVNTLQTATYIVTPSISNCGEGLPFTVTVSVPPTPEINVITTVTCSGVAFVVTPTNITDGIVPNGTLYTWAIPSFTGSVTGGVSASNYPTIVTGKLLNRTNTVQTVTYKVNPISGVCAGTSFTVIVTLNPTPEITAMTRVICSGTPFVVTPTNNVNGIVPSDTRYSWSAPIFTGSVTGGVSASNVLTIVSGTLLNRTNTVQTVTYLIEPNTISGSCFGTLFTLTISLNPTPEIVALSTVTCSGVTF